MRDILTPHLAQISKNIFFNGELGMIHGDHTVFSLLMRHKPPLTINDHRFGMIINGEAHINWRQPVPGESLVVKKKQPRFSTGLWT